MERPKISLCASAVRIEWWMRLYNSLKYNTIPWEIVFVGNVRPNFELPSNFKFVYASVKPAQSYQIAFWEATGELIAWTADDADYNAHEINCPNSLDIAYEAWHRLDSQYGNDKKSIIAMNPCEDGGWPQAKFHRFFGGWGETPTMAPFGVLNREYFVNHLGGYDKHFVSGQSENDVVMRIFEDGGRLEVAMDAKLYVRHSQVHPKHPNTGKPHTKFRTDYNKDRERLENCWVKGGYGYYEKLNSFRNNDVESRKEVVSQISKTRLLPFEPFEKTEDVCFVNQGESGHWGK